MDQAKLEQKYVNDYWISKLRPKNVTELKVPDDREFYAEELIDIDSLAFFFKLTRQLPWSEFVVLLSVYHVLLSRQLACYRGLIASPAAGTVSGDTDAERYLYFSPQHNTGRHLKQLIESVKAEVQQSLRFHDYDLQHLQSSVQGLKLPFDNFQQFVFVCDSVHGGYYEQKQGHFALHIQKHPDGGLLLKLRNRLAAVTPVMARQFVQHFKFLLTELEHHLSADIFNPNWLTNAERSLLVNSFSGAERSFPAHKTLADLFEEQAEMFAGNPAIFEACGTISYRQLNEMANKLAHFLLKNYNTGPGEVVGVMLPKSGMAVVSILAILKTGAAYLPIASDYPQDRIRYMIENSNIRVLITLSHIECIVKANLARIDYDKISLEKESPENCNRSIISSDLAYLIYTSGSTGNPKGVKIRHRGVVNMSLDQIRLFSVKHTDSIILFAPLSFDASVSEIFMALLSGACLAIPSEHIVKDKDKLVQFLKDGSVTIATFPPTYLNLLTDTDIQGLQCIITAGEPPNIDRALKLSLWLRYFNAYGPTEYTVCVSTYQVTAADKGAHIIPIGKPIANTFVYILNDELQPVPVGIEGKIYVSGEGLTAGYHNLDVLTAKKIIANPFLSGAYMYDTGDMGRWRADGNIEFTGRKDEQVKLRGFRIELAEIETAVLSFSADMLQAAAAVQTGHDEKALVLYYVSLRQVSRQELKDFLSGRLPDFMRPQHYVQVQQLPFLPNGKVDRNTLTTLVNDAAHNASYEPPANETEAALATIWKNVLRINEVGRNDDFFQLGGNSLHVMRMLSALAASSLAVEYRQVYQTPVLKDLAVVLMKANASQLPEQYPGFPAFVQQHAAAGAYNNAAGTAYSLTPQQSKFYFLSLLNGEAGAFNIVHALHFNSVIDKELLSQKISMLVAQHDILRTAMTLDEEGGPAGFVEPVLPSDDHLLYTDLSVVESHAKNSSFEELLKKETQHSFEIDLLPLFRLHLVKMSEHECKLVIVMHHIISDGWTLQLLVTELQQWVNSKMPVHRAVDAPGYSYYAALLKQFMQSEHYRPMIAYWKQKLLPGAKHFATITTRGNVPTVQGAGNDFFIGWDKELSDRALHYAREKPVSLFVLLMTVLKLAIRNNSTSSIVNVATITANRQVEQFVNTYGNFSNLLVLSDQMDPHESNDVLLHRIEASFNEAFRHQLVPYEEVRETLQLKQGEEIFDTLFVFQNFADAAEVADESYKIAVNGTPYCTLAIFGFMNNNHINFWIKFNSQQLSYQQATGFMLEYEALFTKFLNDNEQTVRSIN